MEKIYRNVCEVIVANDVCIGCGICAGICPVNVLEMQLNMYGEYQPMEKSEGCISKCDLCLRVCPFWNQKDNEDTLARAVFESIPGINQKSETGYYLESYAGYSNVDGHRANGASGGLATWLLETILREGLVDHVICVTHNPDPKKLYQFSVLSSTEEIRRASRSCYYPVELSEVISYVLHNDGLYAVIGLPCFLKGLRLAFRTSKKLQKRIKYLFGLVCGQNKSTFFSAYLCKLKGGDPQYMNYCHFRAKDEKRNANDFGFSFNCTKGSIQSGSIFWNEGMGEAWTKGFFKPNACYQCDDIFAEVADAVLMDAWLDRYMTDSKGTNFMLLRNSVLREMVINDKYKKEIHLELTPIDDIIRSQQAVIDIKRGQLAQRQRLAKIIGRQYLPRKRINPSSFNPITLFERYLEERISYRSKMVISKYGITEGFIMLNRTIANPLLVLRIISGIRNRMKIPYFIRQINRLRSMFTIDKDY